MERKGGEEDMGKIIILGSEKGGVAKTTSTFNLAYALAKEGKKVLAVDFDSQANLSTCFGIEDTAAVPVTIGHLMMHRIEDEDPTFSSRPKCCSFAKNGSPSLYGRSFN